MTNDRSSSTDDVLLAGRAEPDFHERFHGGEVVHDGGVAAMAAWGLLRSRTVSDAEITMKILLGSSATLSVLLDDVRAELTVGLGRSVTASTHSGRDGSIHVSWTQNCKRMVSTAKIRDVQIFRVPRSSEVQP